MMDDSTNGDCRDPGGFFVGIDSPSLLDKLMTCSTMPIF